jgi:hypothetical protein
MGSFEEIYDDDELRSFKPTQLRPRSRNHCRTWFSHRNTGCGSALFYPVRARRVAARFGIARIAALYLGPAMTLRERTRPGLSIIRLARDDDVPHFVGDDCS